MFVKNMFFTWISKLHSSRYLSGDFQSNVGCFSTGPQVFVTASAGLVVLTGVSVSAVIPALAPIASCIKVCVLLSSDAILATF